MRGPAVDDGPLDALAMMGASPAQLAELREWLQGQAADFGLWPENQRPVQVLAMMATQWRVSAMGGYMGLDYNVLPFVLRTAGIGKKHEADTFVGLQILEREVLSLMADKS